MVEDGQKAVDQANREKYHLHFNGYPDAGHGWESKQPQKIREGEGSNKDTPIVALTANAFADVQGETRKAKMNGIIIKPVRRKSFLYEVLKWVKFSKGQEKDHADARQTFLEDDVENDREKAKTLPIDFQTVLHEFNHDQILVKMALEQFISSVEKQCVHMEQSLKVVHGMQYLKRPTK